MLALVPFSIPNLLLFHRAPQHFLQNTFVFQIFRGEEANLAGIFLQKLAVFAKMIIEPYLFLLLIAVIASVKFLRQERRLSSRYQLFDSPEGMALLNLVALAAVYLVPYPILRHYAEQYLGFAIIVASLSAERMIAVFNENIPLKWQKFVTGGLIALLALSLTEILGFEYPLPFSHEERMKYKLCDNIYLRDELSRRTPVLAVIINEPPAAFTATLDSGYSREYQTGSVSIYKRR